jgi:hypothetical protein
MIKFVVSENRWFGWQMLPGYVGERCIPYCCPIYVKKVTPKKTGKKILHISFWNTGYAQGVQDFELDMRLIHHGSDYLVAELLYDGDMANERCAVISHIEFGWIEKFCPHIWHNNPPNGQQSVSLYLNQVFGIPNEKQWQTQTDAE